MNLRAIANANTHAVNANILVDWVQSTGGYTTAADGSRVATVATTTIAAQVQSMSGSDLQKVNGLNIQGVMRAVYISENVQGVVRADKQGGDILRFPIVTGGDVKEWRVVQVLETWPEWSKVAVVLQ